MKDILNNEFIDEHGRPDVIVQIPHVPACTKML